MKEPKIYASLYITTKAIQYTKENVRSVLKFMSDGGVTLVVDEEDRTTAYIPTKRGILKAKPSDYIVLDINGEFYPCAEEDFHVKFSRIYHPELMANRPVFLEEYYPKEILEFFSYELTYEDLPKHLQNASKPFCDLAYDVFEFLSKEHPRPDTVMETVLRLLLEAKDCAVRASLSHKLADYDPFYTAHLEEIESEARSLLPADASRSRVQLLRDFLILKHFWWVEPTNSGERRACIEKINNAAEIALAD